MTRAETELMLRLTQDTNDKVSLLNGRLDKHMNDDTLQFRTLTNGLERNDTRWRILHWAFWPTLGILMSFLGYRVLN